MAGAVRQIGIKLVIDGQSAQTELPKMRREFDQVASSAEQAAARTSRGLQQMDLSIGSIVKGAAGLHVVAGGFNAITEAIKALPKAGFDYSSQMETTQLGMAGILGSMTAINGKQTDFNQALLIGNQYIRKLNDDALRTAATSQELTGVFQALLAPGLGARMTLDEIRQLTVVGTNAVKSMGLAGAQVVQELRDLVQGGITASGSTLATALGLKDADIAKARASSEGLFKFLMDRLQGFKASSEAFDETFKGKFEQLKEGATRVAAEGLDPIFQASKQALGEVGKLFTTIDQAGNVSLNQGLVDDIRGIANATVSAAQTGREWVGIIWENRDAAVALGSAWAGIRLGGMVTDIAAAVAAKIELAQASRLASVQAAAESASNAEVVLTSRQKVAALLSELQTKAAAAQAEVAAQAAQIATLNTTREAIVLSRAEVVAKLEATRVTIAQTEAQIVAARAAGAQSFAIAALREGTNALTVAQARHAALLNELALLGQQQARVTTAMAAATAAQTAATNAAATSAATLQAANTAASASAGVAALATRGLGAAVGLLGGPIGIVTTALTVGVTAWQLWGTSGANAQTQVQSAVARSTAEIVADLNKQIQKLQERNGLQAAGLGDLAKQGGEAADKLGALQAQISNLQANKGPDGGAPLPEAARVALLQTLLKQYASLAGTMQTVNAKQAEFDKGASTGQNMTLTLQGQEQAWRKVLDGIKTTSAAQQEYETKLSASRQAFAQYEAGLKSSNADPAVLKAAQAEQLQAERALADERDKKLREIGAAGVTAKNQSIDAQIEAVKAGYKREAEVTANGLADLDALHKQDLVGAYDYIERGAELRMQDLAHKEAAVRAELALVSGKKDSAKEQAKLEGELKEIAQQRANLEANTAREIRAADAQHLEALDKRAKAEQNLATQAQDKLRNAKLDQLEIGKTGAALGELRAARMEDAAAELERQAVVADGIDLSKRSGDALREQAKAMRENFKVGGYNDAARSVAAYAKSVDEANAAIEFEQSLAGLSQRDRDIALEQYRIAVNLKALLAQIDADNPNDKEGAAKLKAEAEAAAAKANAMVGRKVAVAEARKTSDEMNDIFRKGFADLVNNGKGAFKAMGQSILTTFKTQVADGIYKMFLEPIVVSVAADVKGSITGFMSALDKVFSTSSGTTGGASTANGLMTVVNGVGALTKAYGALTSSWTAPGSAFMKFASSGLGQKIGLTNSAPIVGNNPSAFAPTGSQLTGLGKGLASAIRFLPWAALIAAGMNQAGKAFDQGYRLKDSTIWKAQGLISPAMNLDTKVAQKLGFSERTANIITGASLVAKVAERLGLQQSLHAGAGAIYQNGTVVGGRENYTYDRFNMGDPREYQASAQSTVDDVAKRAGSAIDGFFSAFGLQSGYKVQTAFADDRSKDGAWGSFRVEDADGKKVLDWKDTQTSKWAPKEFANGEAGFKEYLAAIDAGIIDTFKASADQLPPWAARIVRAADSAGGEAGEALETLMNDLGSYPEKMLELIGTSTDQLASKFKEDLVAGDTRGAGENFANSIVGGIEDALVGNFATQVTSSVSQGMVTPFIDAMINGATTSEAISAMSTAQTLKRVKEQAAAFKEIWNNADFQAALAEIRTTISSTVTAGAEGAAYVPKYTSAIKENTQATKEATDAENERKRIADQRKSLQDRIDDLTMTREQLIAKERLTIDASNHDLYDRLMLLENEKRIMDERKGIEQTWLNAVGATAELRRRELDAIDPANRGLQELVYRLEDIQTAADKASEKVNSDYNVLSRSVDAEKKALAERLAAAKEGLAAQTEAARDAVSKITSIFNALKSAIKSVEVESDELNRSRRAAADATLRDALTQVKTGVRIDSITGLEDALQTVGKPSDQLYGRFSDYAKAQDESADLIRQLTGHAGDQLSVADLTLKATESAAKALDKQYQQDIAALDQTLKVWRDNIDAVNDVDISVISVRDAVNNLAGSLAASKAANEAVKGVTGGALAGYTTTQIQGGVNFIRDRVNAGDIGSIYQGAVKTGMTTEQLVAAINLAGYQVTAEQVRAWGAQSGLPPLTGVAAPSAAAGAAAGAGNASASNPLSDYTNEQVAGGVNFIREQVNAGDLGSIYQGAANSGMSAEQLAAAIVKAGYDVTADQVRDWGASAGLPSLRKFATGGAFTGGGVVRRPTYFDIGQMGEAGEEGILPLSNINGKLGVSASGMGTGAIVAAIEALQALLATVAANTEAGALHAYKGAKATQDIADRGVGVKPIAGLPLEIAS